MATHISELLSSPDSFIGKEIVISGNLLVDGSDGMFLAISAEAKQKGAYICLHFPQLVKEFYTQLDPYGGGPFLFDEKAEISGTCERCSCGNGVGLQIKDVKYLNVITPKEVFTFRPVK